MQDGKEVWLYKELDWGKTGGRVLQKLDVYLEGDAGMLVQRDDSLVYDCALCQSGGRRCL